MPVSSKKKTLLLFIGIFAVAGISALIYIQRERDAKMDALRFSNTMTWNPRFFARAQEETYYVPDWKDVIRIPEPSRNSSRETRRDIDIVLSYKKLRTEERVLEIQNEMDELNPIVLGGRPIGDYVNKKKFPKTALLLKKACTT